MQRVLGEVARLYRVGGDEFVATVVDTDEAGFRSLVERLQGSVPKVGVSIRFWRAGEACPRKTDIV